MESRHSYKYRYIAIAISRPNKVKSVIVSSYCLKPILDSTLALPEMPTDCGVCVDDCTVVRDYTGATDGWIKTTSGWTAIPTTQSRSQSGTTSNRQSSPVVGQTYFDTSLSPKRMIVYNGTDWVNLDGSALS